jgi:hypothetical protein
MHEECDSMACAEPFRNKPTSELEEIRIELRKTRLEVKILQLVSTGIISAGEFRSLTRMCNSVDIENLVVAEETVQNLIKNL